MHEKIYGDRHRGTIPLGEINTRGVAKMPNIAILDLSKALGNGARQEVS